MKGWLTDFKSWHRELILAVSQIQRSRASQIRCWRRATRRRRKKRVKNTMIQGYIFSTLPQRPTITLVKNGKGGRKSPISHVWGNRVWYFKRLVKEKKIRGVGVSFLLFWKGNIPEDYMPSPLESALTNQNLNEETTGEKKRKLSSSGDEGMVVISLNIIKESQVSRIRLFVKNQLDYYLINTTYNLYV